MVVTVGFTCKVVNEPRATPFASQLNVPAQFKAESVTESPRQILSSVTLIDGARGGVTIITSALSRGETQF